MPTGAPCFIPPANPSIITKPVRELNQQIIHKQKLPIGSFFILVGIHLGRFIADR